MQAASWCTALADAQPNTQLVDAQPSQLVQGAGSCTTLSTTAAHTKATTPHAYLVSKVFGVHNIICRSLCSYK